MKTLKRVLALLLAALMLLALMSCEKDQNSAGPSKAVGKSEKPGVEDPGKPSETVGEVQTVGNIITLVPDELTLVPGSAGGIEDDDSLFLQKPEKATEYIWVMITNEFSAEMSLSLNDEEDIEPFTAGETEWQGKTNQVWGEVDGEIFLVALNGFKMDDQVVRDVLASLHPVNAAEPDEPSEPDGPVEPDEPETPDEPEVRENPYAAWNGTWFGYQYFDDCTGAYEGTADSYFACYFVIDVDETGSGEFTVYNSWEEWASGTCQIVGDQLHATSGNAFGVDMNLDNWRLYPSRTVEHLVVLDDVIEADAGVLEYDIYLKPWGVDWQDRADSFIYEELLGEYEQMAAAGEEPLYGYTNPLYFNGGNASSGGASSGENPGGATALSGDLAQINVEYSGMLQLSYPTDTWEEKVGAIFTTIKTKDSKTQISMDTLLGSSNYEELKSNYSGSGYTEKPEYSLEEGLTIAGYPAMRMTYYDDWSGHIATYVVWFDGESVDGIFGAKFTATASASMDDATSDTVLAILNTLTVTE